MVAWSAGLTCLERAEILICGVSVSLHFQSIVTTPIVFYTAGILRELATYLLATNNNRDLERELLLELLNGGSQASALFAVLGKVVL